MMDTQALLQFIGASTVLTVGVVIGRSLTVRRDIALLGKKVHDLTDWKNATLPKEYVQQRELSLTLKPLTESIGELKTQQTDIAKDLKSLTRWIDQHGAADT